MQRAKALFCDGHHIASATVEIVCCSSIAPAWAVRRFLTQPRLMRGFSLGLGDIVSPQWAGVILVAANPRRVLPA